MLHRERLERRERGRFFWGRGVPYGCDWVRFGGGDVVPREVRKAREGWRGGGGEEWSGWFFGIWNWLLSVVIC